MKKKLDSYLASGLLAQFQGLRDVSHPHQSMPSSSSMVQESSADDNVPKGGTEAENISESSQESAVVGCSQSISDATNAEIHARGERQLTKEFSQEKDPSFNQGSSSENYHTALEGVAFSIPQLPPCILSGSSQFLEHNITNDWGNFSGQDWQRNSDELPNINSPDLGQESSEFLTHCVNENHREVPLQTSEGLSACPSMGNVVFDSDQPEGILTSEDGISRVMYPETDNDAHFSSGNFIRCSNFSSFNGSTVLLFNQSSNYQVPETEGASASESCYPSDVLATSSSQPFTVPSQIPPDDGTVLFDGDPNQLGDLSLHQEEELLESLNGGFICTNESLNSSCNGGRDNMDLQYHQDRANDSSEPVQLDAFNSGPLNNTQTCPSVDEDPVVPTEQEDMGTLCYEPPRFPSLDIPFFSCDLIQSGSEMQEYSPLGIRQLMMSTANCFSPFRLWDSPSRDSPDAVLKNAAQTFTCTPSILKKRNRDLVSPMSENRNEKRLESNINQESFSSLSRDFSQLDFLFDENKENFDKKVPSLSPLSKQKGKSRYWIDNKENMIDAVGVGKESILHSLILDKEFDSSNPKDNAKQGLAIVDAKTKGDSDVATQNVSLSYFICCMKEGS